MKDGHRALQIEIVYRERPSRKWLCTGKGSNWRQYRLWGGWHIKFTRPNR